MPPIARALAALAAPALAAALVGASVVAAAAAPPVAPGALRLDAPGGCEGAARVAAGEALALRLVVDGAATTRLDLQLLPPGAPPLALATDALVRAGLTYALDLPLDGVPGAYRLVARVGALRAECAVRLVPARGPRLVAPAAVDFPAAGPARAREGAGAPDRDAPTIPPPPPDEAGARRRAVTLRNAGDAPLRIHAVSVYGGDAAAFVVRPDGPLPLLVPPGGARDVLLVAAPVGARPAAGADGVLVVRSDDPLHRAVGIPLRAPGSAARPEVRLGTPRGCLEEGALPVWFAGEAIAARAAVEGAPAGALDAAAPPGALQLAVAHADGALRPLGAAWGPAAEPRPLVAAPGQTALVATLREGASAAVATCAHLVAAPVTRLAGRVTAPGEAGARAVAGRRVVLHGPAPAETLTDPAGRFVFDLTRPGDYVLTAVAPRGYANARTRLRLSAPGAPAPPVALPLEAEPGAPPAAGATDPAPAALVHAPPAPAPGAGADADAAPADAAPAQSPSCAVRISPTDATLNVGQLVTFRAYTTPTRGSFSYRWTVEGDVVGDYSEGTAGPWRTMPLVPSALTARELTLAWRPDESQRFPRNDGPLARRVRVEVSDGRGNCADQVVMQVERNATSATRQAEDWYTSNHARYIAREHALWHQRYPFDSLVYDGAIFFDFHVQFLDRFERWRAEFGYGPIGIWDPATPVPTGVDIDHAPRSGRYGPLPRPAWSTAAGGAPRPWNFMPCDWSRGGQRALTEFPSDRRLLGCAVTETWHNTVHLTVGGDMQDPPTSPRDPLFWRWHRYVDTISRERLALGGAASAAAGAAPPRVVAQFPFRLFDFLTDLGSVSLLFDRPVRGLTPAALTVGGVPATAVAGAGAGPYRFSGFGAPRGAVTVRFAGAGVTGADGAAAADAEWSHTVLPPDGDLDGDGLDNAEEIELALSPPDAADADGDGLSDFEEWRVRGTLARWADSDGDGALDGCEVAEGSDPADPRDAAAGCDPAPVWLCGTRP